MTVRLRANRFAVVLLVLVSGVPAVLAHNGAMGVVKQRMDAMKAIGEHMKAMAAMAKGEAAFDPAAVEASATVIARHAGEIPSLFPEGSMNKPTEALPGIWTRWDDFTGIAKKMEADALALAEAGRTARSAGEFVPALAEVGKSCKECHRSFRQAK